MPPKINCFWEGYITALSEEGMSQRDIAKRCMRKVFPVSETGVRNVIKHIGKESAATSVGEKWTRKQHLRRSRTREVVKKVKALVDGENPAIQRAIAARA